MKTVTQPLREEHKTLLPHIESLRAAGDAIRDDEITPATRKTIEKAYEFLTRHLIPHARAEDRELYPVVQRVMGSPAATATMSRDHVEVHSLTLELKEYVRVLGSGKFMGNQANELRRVLYGLYTLVKIHFIKEEEIYLPLLDTHLSEQEAREMFDAMEAFVKGHAH